MFDMRMGLVKSPMATLALLVSFTAQSVGADPGAGKVIVELNKLEAADAGCQPYLLFENSTEIDFASLKLDLVMFDKEGIIIRRVAVKGAPLSRGKTVVKIFNINELSCDKIGRILLNGLTQCVTEEGDRSDCLVLLDIRSRSPDVTFIK